MPLGTRHAPCPGVWAAWSQGSLSSGPRVPARGVPAMALALSQLLPWLLPHSAYRCHRPSESPFPSSALGLQPAHVRGRVQQWPGCPEQTYIAALVCEVADAFLGADCQLHRNNPA